MTKYLEDIIPASQRRRVYALLGLLAYLGGIVQAVLLAVPELQAPLWLKVAGIVLTLAGGGAAQVAQANTPAGDTPKDGVS